MFARPDRGRVLFWFNDMVIIPNPLPKTALARYD